MIDIANIPIEPTITILNHDDMAGNVYDKLLVELI